MRPSISAIAFLIVLLPLTASAEAAVQPGPSSPAALFGDRTEVRVVNVEVFVTRDGESLSGLTRDEFRVFEDGEPMELRYFTEIDVRRPPDRDAVRPASEEEGLEEAFRREPGRFVVYVDSLFLGPARRDRVFSQLIGTMGESLNPRDQVMVVTFDGSLKIRSPFTTDRKRTYEALKEAAELDGIQIAAGLDELRALETIREYQSLGFENACLHVGAVAQQHAQRMEQRVVASVDALEAFVNSLGGLPGRKTILHLSDGIPLIAGGPAWRYALELCDGTGAIKGVPHAMDAPVQDGGGPSGPRSDKWNPTHYRNEMFTYDTSDEWRRLAAHANAHNVALYPFQTSGLGAVSIPGDVRTSQETASFARWNRQDSLAVMSEETGGRAILNTNDFRKSIEGVIGDSRHYYLLGFEPGSSEPSSRHEIRVEVDRPGVRVRHRKSYWTKSTEDEMADSVLTALLHSWGENPLAAELSVEPKRLGDGYVRNRATVRLRVPFEGLTLLSQDSSRQGMLTVMLSTRTPEGEMTPIRRAAIPLKVPFDPEREEFVYEIDLPIEGSGKEVAVALRDDFGGATSFLRQTIRLEAP